MDPSNFGVLEAKKLAGNAETYSMMVAPHNVGGIVSTLVGIHLMAGFRNGKILEHFNDFADTNVKNAGTPYPEVVNGYFPLPEGPGWGVELNYDFIEKNSPSTTEDGVIQDPGLDMFRNRAWHQRGQE